MDFSGNAYVTGTTDSTNFPTVNSHQPAYGGGYYDVFVTKFNSSGSALVYSTYLGGSGDDGGTGIGVDSSGNAYVAGQTRSTNFPTVIPIQRYYGGGELDAFVAKFNSSGNALLYSTYVGGSGYDMATAIAVNGLGNAYVTGQTSSTNFRTFNPLQPANAGNVDVFVTKFIPRGICPGLLHVPWR